MIAAPPQDIEAQIASAYRAMSPFYRPAAPSDGLGHITVPDTELDIDAEIESYARDWWQWEDDCTFVIGCAHYPHRETMIYAIEAARACCFGRGGEQRALRLLKLATEAMTRCVEP